MIDLVIKNGSLVWPDGTLKADVAIDEGKIAAIGSSSSMPQADRVIDAEGKFILPGLIDPHVHIHLPFMGVVAVDDFYTATVAGASGGVTTVIDFAIQKRGSSLMDAIASRRKEADGRVVIDYSLHSSVTDATDETIAEIKQIIDYGIPSFKLFMVYRKEGWMISDAALMDVLNEARMHGGVVGVHAENVAIIEHLVDKALREGNKSAIYHAYTRPSVCEAEAINRALFLSRTAQAPLYIFHMTTKEGTGLLRDARMRGEPRYAETCTQYLLLTKELLKRSDGINYICSPPLRDQDDATALWKGLEDGSVSAVGTDHSAYSLGEKKLGEQSFDKVPNGFPGMEFRLPLLFTEGVLKNRISINRLVAVTSTNVAKIFGLYPKKGTIAVGSDADIVIMDPSVEKTISSKGSLYGIDWSPYEGIKVKGNAAITISKGKVIFEAGEFKGKAGDGKFLERRISKEVLTKRFA